MSDHYFEVAQKLEARIAEQKKAHAERKRVIDEAKAVLDDYFDSVDPRSTQHAMQALRRIICGTGLCEPIRTDFVRDAIRSACAKLGMSPDVADKLAAPPRPHCDDHAGWRSDCDRCAMYEPPHTAPDPLHPTGRCTCGGEGSCEWCMSHCDHCGGGYPDGVVKRTEADQRVLDAWRETPVEMLRFWATRSLDELRLASLAELARRGLKP